MKSKIFSVLVLCVLLSGCASNTSDYDDTRESAYQNGYRIGYEEGYEEGIWEFENTFNEESVGSYNWLAESYVFYAKNVCLILPDNIAYHTCFGCSDAFDAESYSLIYVEDAETYGYTKCPVCYENMEVDYMPLYEEFVEHFEPEFNFEKEKNNSE